MNAFTPIVGYNNAGKSTILSAMEWLLAPSALTAADFNAPDQPIIVEGTVVGIDDAILDSPEQLEWTLTNGIANVRLGNRPGTWP
mgnify:CR=1 FL=1